MCSKVVINIVRFGRRNLCRVRVSVKLRCATHCIVEIPFAAVAMIIAFEKITSCFCFAFGGDIESNRTRCNGESMGIARQQYVWVCGHVGNKPYVRMCERDFMWWLHPKYRIDRTIASPAPVHPFVYTVRGGWHIYVIIAIPINQLKAIAVINYLFGDRHSHIFESSTLFYRRTTAPPPGW